jgi:hypothetical protein
MQVDELNKLYFDQLIADILNHPLVKKSVLGLFQNWQRSQYRQLATIIGSTIDDSTLISKSEKNEMGTNISESTLLRIFKERENFAKNFDPRVMRTLDKLAVFVGYHNWETFCLRDMHEVNLGATSMKQSEEEAFEKETILQVVMACNELSYSFHFDIPNMQLDLLEQYFVKDSPGLVRLAKFHESIREKGWVINKKENATSFEVMESSVELKDAENAIVKTKEFWLLEYFDPQTGRDFIYKNDVSEQLYFMVKQNGKWLIKNNFNEKASRPD